MMQINEKEANVLKGPKKEIPPPSIFRLNFLEILGGVLMGILLIWSFRQTVLGLVSFTSPNQFNPEFNDAKADLLRNLSWFFFPLGFLAAVSLIRTIRRQHHFVPRLGFITPRGYFTYTWPVLLVVPDIQILFVMAFFICLPLILLITVIVYAFSKREYDNRGDIVPVLLNVLTFLPFIFYTVNVWELVGRQIILTMPLLC